MADGIVINKADGDNIDRAKLAQAQYRSALQLLPTPPSKWKPEVLCYSGYYELGIPEIWDMVDRYFKFVDENGFFERQRRDQARYWMYETIDAELRRRFYDDPDRAAAIANAERLVLSNRLSPFTAALQLLGEE